MVDTADSKSAASDSVRVRVPFPLPYIKYHLDTFAGPIN